MSVSPYSFRIHSSASWQRLEKLIEARTQTDADKTLLDARIWELFGEQWAVMFTDLSGFSRRVNDYGIVHFLQTIYESHRLLVPCIDQHNGILLKIEGDSMLVIFKRPERALECALAMQSTLRSYNMRKTPSEQVLLCIGMGYGDMLKIGDEDVFGAEVNAASKLGEDTADPGEILITASFQQMLSETLIEEQALHFEALDEAPPGATGAYQVLSRL